MLSDLSGARATITLGDYDGMMLNEDVWTYVGEKPLSVEMVRGATCFEKKDLLVHEVLEVADPDLYESLALRPKGLLLLRSLRSQSDRSTNLRTCPSGPVRAKSQQNHSRLLKTKQPVIQLDYAFLGDNSDDSQVTLLTAIDFPSGLDFRALFLAKAVQFMLRRNFGDSFWKQVVPLAYFRLIPSLR